MPGMYRGSLMQQIISYMSAGESHGPAEVLIIRGLPAGFHLDIDALDRQLQRRQQGYGRGGRMRIEKDEVRVLSGLRHGITLASPLTLMIENKDHARWRKEMDPLQGEAQSKVRVPRPGHADFAGAAKYGFDDIRNVLERASARETAARILAGAVCRQFLEELGMRLGSYLIRLADVRCPDMQPGEELFRKAEESDVRCPDPKSAELMRKAIDKAKAAGDSLGGIFRVAVLGLPPGLGSYVHWDEKLTSRIAAEIMGIQAVRGIAFGAGFEGAGLSGSAYHDIFVIEKERIKRATNRAGGLEGGMSNGEVLQFDAVMKPIPTLTSPLDSFNMDTMKKVTAHQERSDVCALPAAAVVAENLCAVPLLNALLLRYGADRWDHILRRVKEDA